MSRFIEERTEASSSTIDICDILHKTLIPYVQYTHTYNSYMVWLGEVTQPMVGCILYIGTGSCCLLRNGADRQKRENISPLHQGRTTWPLQTRCGPCRAQEL